MRYDIDKMAVDVDYLDRAIAGDADAIAVAFYWIETPQGDDFWIHQDAGKTPLDIDALKDIKRQYMHHTGTAGKLKDMHVKVGDVVRNSVSGNEYTIKERLPGVLAVWGGVDDGFFGCDVVESKQEHTLISLADDEQPDAQKTWGDMTDDERVDVLYEKLKGAPTCIRGKNRVRTALSEIGAIKPEPVRETVSGWWNGKNFHNTANYVDRTHRITFDTIDGEPDCSTIKMERITKEESK